LTGYSQLLAELRLRLVKISQTPFLDATVLLAHVLGKSRAWVLAHPEVTLTAEQQLTLENALVHLEDGEPLPYVLGHWEFYTLDFDLSPSVLIPRPETELLVEQAFSWLRAHPTRRFITDVGTGSGCIAVALAVNILDLHVIASDISMPALQLGLGNAQKHGVADRVAFICSDLLPPVSLQYDLICVNLPYIACQILETLAVYKHEPRIALDGGEDGLEIIRRLLKAAPQYLAPGGRIFLEIEASQGEAVKAIARIFYPYAEISLLPDLAGCDRLLSIQT
jgi:release factor glutamine methyltransferase